MPLNNPPPLPQDVAAVLVQAQALHHWIAARQDDLVISAEDTSRVPGVLLDLCVEHHVGIVHLTTACINGSAFALLRVQLEALIRALWLLLCATPEQFKKFVQDDKCPLVGDMIPTIESHPEFADKALSRIYFGARIAMHGYTHGGMHQISRRLKGETIEPNFDPEEVKEVLRASGFFALLALRQMGRLAATESLVAEVNLLLNAAKPQ